MPRKPRVEIDEKALERDWRAGIIGDRELARRYGISHTAVAKMAARLGWVRDLKDKIRAKAAAMIAREDAAKALAKPKPLPEEEEKDVVEANAAVQVLIIREHRRGLNRARTIVDKLFTQLEQGIDNRDLIEQLALALAGDDDKRGEVLRKLANGPMHVDMTKKLVDALRAVIDTERTVYGINAGSGDSENPLATLIRGVMGTGFKPVAEND